MVSVEYWVWLQQVLGYGSDVVSRVASVYKTAEEFYKAPDDEKIKSCRLSKVQAARLHSIPKKQVFGIIKAATDNGITLLTPDNCDYPKKLLHIPDFPAVLYVKGKHIDFNRGPFVAVVGPRKVSDYGVKCAYVIAEALSSCGFTVVSGGALGGDSAAHKGAIAGKGDTVGVLGSGIGSDYLKVNEALRGSISENGCLVSEYPPFTKVTRGSFPMRNRIMSGLCDGIVIVEGGKGSGTMNTARHAEEQGRDVFVIPGSPTLPQYEGSNRLIADGAKMLLNINDIIEEYIPLYKDKIQGPKETLSVTGKADALPLELTAEPKNSSKRIVHNDADRETVSEMGLPDIKMLSDDAVAVLNCFENYGGDFTSDVGSSAVNDDAGRLLGSVTELEICGFITALPGGRYRLNKYK